MSRRRHRHTKGLHHGHREKSWSSGHRHRHRHRRSVWLDAGVRPVGTDSCLRREGGVLAHPLYLLLRIAAGPLSLSSMVRGFGLRNSLTRPAGTPIPPRECPRESGWEDMANDRVCHAALRCRPSISNQVFRAARHNGLGRFASQRTSEGGERQWEPGKMPWC